MTGQSILADCKSKKCQLSKTQSFESNSLGDPPATKLIWYQFCNIFSNKRYFWGRWNISDVKIGIFSIKNTKILWRILQQPFFAMSNYSTLRSFSTYTAVIWSNKCRQSWLKWDKKSACEVFLQFLLATSRKVRKLWKKINK